MTIDDIKYGYYFYFHFFFKYFSWRKFLNFTRSLIDFTFKKEKIHSFPFVASIDPANLCILSCPLCPTGKKEKGAKKETLSLADFKKYFDQIKDYLFVIRLYNWGEPFLAKDIFQMIDYAHKNNVGVVVNSNLNVLVKDFAKKMVESKLDYLMVSIDGVTQKNYQIYRRGGKLDKALKTCREIVNFKRKSQSNLPVLHWSFLVNRYNYSETNKARTLAKKIGFNLITFSPLSLVTKIGEKVTESNKEFWLGEDIQSQRGESSPSSACYFLWTSVNISPNGDIFPCCGIYEDKYRFGNLNKNSFSEIWNNKWFQCARNQFSGKLVKNKVVTICHQCDWFKK